MIDTPDWYVEEFKSWWRGEFNDWAKLDILFYKGYSARQAYDVCRYRWEV